MARARFFRHSHESTILNFGHFGTATYDENDHEWHFIREPAGNTATNSEDAVSVRIIGHTETLIPANIAYNSKKAASNIQNDLKVLTQIGLHSNNLPRDFVFEGASAFPEHNLEPLTFGSALRLGGDDTQSGHSTIPIMAYVSGIAQDVLELRCIGRRNIKYEDMNGVTKTYQIPSIKDGEETSESSFEGPILQMSFSTRRSGLQKDTILALRQASCTTILQPLIHLELSRTSSTLDANILTKIPSSMTGGASHVYTAFHPRNSNVLAIVDVEGNWSIWDVQGKRRYDARISYRTSLRASGRIFSFSNDKRPDNVGLFYDGWHKTCWLSNDKETMNRLLVCNRQTALLFNLEGVAVAELDTRLGSKSKGRWILDVRPVFDDSHCIILTDANVLLFSASQREWKDANRIESPKLLCAWRHFRNESTKSIKMALCYDEITAFIILTTDESKLATLYTFQQNFSTSKTSVRAADPLTLHLPSLHQCIVTIKAVPLCVSTTGPERSLLTPCLVKLFLCEKDHSVHSILLELSNSWNFSDELCTPILRLPPKKLSLRRSTRFVGEDGDEELSLFITNSDHESTPPSPYSFENNLDNNSVGVRQDYTLIDLRLVYSELLKEISSQHKIGATSILSLISSELQRRLEQSIESINPVAELLSTLIPPYTQVLEIEQDSKIFSEHLNRLMQHTDTQLIDNVEGRDETEIQTLMQIYHFLLNSFVSSLAPSIPGRIRLQRERTARDISLQIYLSTFIIWRTPITVPSESVPIPATDESIQTDPLLSSEADSTMPDAFASNHNLTGDVIQLPLRNALKNLSRFTRIDTPPFVPLSREISDILAHLPSSADANPTAYSYQDIELDLALERGREYEAKLGPRARRRADKTARAKQRALERQSQLRNTASQSLSIPSISTGSRPLVIRNAQSSQVQPPTFSSSQEDERISKTQPEAGVHGGRKEVKKNPRKKRIAGF